VRALIRFGFGMRPSFTTMSNSDGEIPMYAAAATRDSSRGGSGGRQNQAWLSSIEPEARHKEPMRRALELLLEKLRLGVNLDADPSVNEPILQVV